MNGEVISVCSVCCARWKERRGEVVSIYRRALVMLNIFFFIIINQTYLLAFLNLRQPLANFHLSLSANQISQSWSTTTLQLYPNGPNAYLGKSSQCTRGTGHGTVIAAAPMQQLAWDIETLHFAPTAFIAGGPTARCIGSFGRKLYVATKFIYLCTHGSRLTSHQQEFEHADLNQTTNTNTSNGYGGGGYGGGQGGGSSSNNGYYSGHQGDNSYSQNQHSDGYYTSSNRYPSGGQGGSTYSSGYGYSDRRY